MARSNNAKYSIYGGLAICVVLIGVLIFFNYSAATGMASRQKMLPAYDNSGIPLVTGTQNVPVSSIALQNIKNEVKGLTPEIKDVFCKEVCSFDATIYCEDSDGGNNAAVGGMVTLKNKDGQILDSKKDKCYNNPAGGSMYEEMICSEGKIASVPGKCQETGAGDKCNAALSACAPECTKNSDCIKSTYTSCLRGKCIDVYQDLTCSGATKIYQVSANLPTKMDENKNVASEAKLLYAGKELTAQEVMSLNSEWYVNTFVQGSLSFKDYCVSGTGKLVKYVCANGLSAAYLNQKEGFTAPTGFGTQGNIIYPADYWCDSGEYCKNGACIIG